MLNIFTQFLVFTYENNQNQNRFLYLIFLYFYIYFYMYNICYNNKIKFLIGIYSFLIIPFKTNTYSFIYLEDIFVSQTSRMIKYVKSKNQTIFRVIHM